MNLRGNNQKIRYIEFIVNDLLVTQVTCVDILYYSGNAYDM